MAVDLQVRLNTLEAGLNREIVGQSDAIHWVAKAVRDHFAQDPRLSKPTVILFHGPKGVGKKELAKALANEIKVPFFSYNMGEVTKSFQVTNLFKAQEGLENQLKKTPICIALLDDFEKGDPEVTKKLSALFNASSVTNNIGRQALFILTSNSSSQEVFQKFSEEGALAASASYYSVFFQPLTEEAIEKIVEKNLRQFQAELQNRKVEITWTREVVAHIIRLQTDSSLGASHISRTIQDQIKSQFPNELLNTFKPGAKIEISLYLGRTIMLSGDNEKDSFIVIQVGPLVLDYSGLSPKLLIGKYVHRIRPSFGDHSFMDDCIKILEVSPNGDILCFYPQAASEMYLNDRWNDNGWAVVSPMRNGEAFFENMISEIAYKERREKAFALSNEIFHELKSPCHLSNEKIFDSLRERCVSQGKSHLLEKVKQLEALTGPLSIAIIIPILSKF